MAEQHSRRWARHVLAATALLGLAACAGSRPPLVAEPSRCLARLDEAGVRYEPAAQPAEIAACAVAEPVRVSAAAIDWNQPGVVSCGFALALDGFARDDVQEAALALFGQKVRRIRHFGTYACRRENGSAHWSLHASGNAIDIAGFDLADGRVVLVGRDWRDRGAAGAFLHEVARRACARFGVVLTPDSDHDHRDHIHIDSGPYKLCGVREITPASSPAGRAARAGAATDSAGSGPSR